MKLSDLVTACEIELIDSISDILLPTSTYSQEERDKLIFADLICRNTSHMLLIQLWAVLLLLSFGNLIFCGSIIIQLSQRCQRAYQAWTVLKTKCISPRFLPNRHSKTCRWNRSLSTHNLMSEKLKRKKELAKWRRNFQQDSFFSRTSRTMKGWEVNWTVPLCLCSYTKNTKRQKRKTKRSRYV